PVSGPGAGGVSRVTAVRFRLLAGDGCRRPGLGGPGARPAAGLAGLGRRARTGRSVVCARRVKRIGRTGSVTILSVDHWSLSFAPRYASILREDPTRQTK